jgi:hypothetical protein
MMGAKAITKPQEIFEDLYVLALKAARQIDLAKRGKGYEQGDVRALFSQLHSGADNNDSSMQHVKDLAPSDIGVLTRALSAFGGAEPKSEEDVVRTLAQLFEEGAKPLEDLEPVELDSLIAFCVTLHDEMLSQRRSLRESRKLRSRFRV